MQHSSCFGPNISEKWCFFELAMGPSKWSGSTQQNSTMRSCSRHRDDERFKPVFRHLRVIAVLLGNATVAEVAP
jgi:hypothetical protein